MWASLHVTCQLHLFILKSYMPWSHLPCHRYELFFVLPHRRYKLISPVPTRLSISTSSLWKLTPTFNSKSYLSSTLHLSSTLPIYLLARDLLTWLQLHYSINKVLLIEHLSMIPRFFESRDITRDFLRSRWAFPHAST